MSQIRAKDTAPEMIVRRQLHSRGYRYRLHVKKLPGTPDIVLPKHRTIIFVHGCFWHGHKGCKFFKLPESSKELWARKIKRTRTLDKLNKAKLIKNSWDVLEIWECTLKGPKLMPTIKSILKQLG